jgi:hypothetical protein
VIKEGRSSEEGIGGQRVKKEKEDKRHHPFRAYNHVRNPVGLIFSHFIKITILTISIDLRGLSNL